METSKEFWYYFSKHLISSSFAPFTKLYVSNLIKIQNIFLKTKFISFQINSYCSSNMQVIYMFSVAEKFDYDIQPLQRRPRQ